MSKTSFTKSEDTYIANNYLTVPVKVMAKELGRSFCGVSGRMKAMGLFIPKQVRQERQLRNRFKKGMVPMNKGRRQTEFMSDEAINKTKATRFEKGRLPHNTKSDFETSIRRDKSGRSYIYIRVALSKWVPYHRYLWEKKNGKIKKGMALIFKDGNSFNVKISNLELLTRKELMQKNTVHNLPKPLAQIVQLRGALNRKIRSKQRKYEK